MSRARLGIPPSVLRRSLPGGTALALTVILALLISACGLEGPSPASPASSSASPSVTLGPSASAAPSPTEPASSGGPTTEPSPTEPTSPGASGSLPVGPTDACFGSQDTRGFFGSFAQAVPWPVYCAVLPTGWSVETGSYFLRDGGRLTISYNRRSDGARIVLDEGALCPDASDCLPTGSDRGTIPFADREAPLVVVSGGAFAAVVDRGVNPSWLLSGTGIGEDDFRAIAAALHLIDQ